MVRTAHSARSSWSADALRLAPATASHHLTTLRDAGLVVGERVGRRLRYLRTGLGEQLGGGAGTPPTAVPPAPVDPSAPASE